jgi:excisionase family DNA binding protein
LEHGEGEVQVSLSRETANLVVRVVEARAAGREVVVANTAQEVTPAEAATITAMSRPQVRKLMDLGHLDFRMVGTHHRVPLDSVNRYMATEPTRRRAALQHLADLQNDLGLLG